jgi:7-cyano-7-deazaguanine synthase
MEQETRKERAVVVLSGGADSTICLGWAKTAFLLGVHAVTFNYGQRHRIEIEAAKKVASMLGVLTHEVIDLGATILKGTSPLISGGGAVGHYEKPEDMPGGIEPTFVPARNQLFLTIAANRAYCLGANTLITGVCEADYGGYPDCRLPFVQSFSRTTSLGLNGASFGFNVVTPLMSMTKAESVKWGMGLPGVAEAMAFTHTCYDGMYPPNPFNHASMIRAKGFHEAGIADPLILRAKAEEELPPDYPDTGYVVGTEFGDEKTWAERKDKHKPKLMEEYADAAVGIPSRR